jgi:transglutaminase-like putative cysteine protease
MSTLEARLERVAGFFRLPYHAYDPAAALAREGEGTWHRLSLAAWLMMYAALIATAHVSSDIVLTIIMGVLLTAAFPVAHRLHSRTTSRLLVNWLTFALAFATGPIFLARYWPLRYGLVGSESVDGMAFLMLCFMWITAFRAFALRTVRDLVETILPCGSTILLSLVVRPTPLSLACMAATVMGALALLAAEHRLAARQQFHPLARLTRTHTTRRAGVFYSWPTLYALVLIVATLTAWGAARSEFAGSWADELRIALAQRLANWMSPHDYALVPDPSVFLARLNSWPNSERALFKVRTKQTANFRVGAYHTYTGMWWQQGVRHMTRATREGDAWRLSLDGSGASLQNAQRAEQTFTAYRVMVGTLPSFFCPVSVKVRQRSLRWDQDNAIRIPHMVRPGDSYTVVSYVQPVIPIRRPGVALDPKTLALDLRLPDTLPRRVRDLARQLTAAERTPYEKARAIEQHLMWEYKYTLSTPSGYPNDFVDYFLFEGQRGFCHHFAGSMVVMCRAIGLPARLASGFLIGEEDKDDADLYTVREKDAHVWPEVYFEGAGWVMFEPTPPAETEPIGLARAWKQIVEGGKAIGLGAYDLFRTNSPLISVLLLVAMLALLAARWQMHERDLAGWRGQEPAMRIVRAYLRLRRLLADRGAPDAPTVTPRELLASLPDALSYLQEEATALTENYLAARFGRTQPSLEAAVAAETQIADLRRHLRKPPHPPSA